MNKPQPDDKLLLARLEDKARLCSDNSMITSSDFLDMHERSLVKNMRLPYPDVKCVFYGAFPDAERTAAVLLPPYIEAGSTEQLAEYFASDPDSDPITVLRVTKDKFSPPLGHRDYLGALMSLGIKREMTGDIRVTDDGCFIAVLGKMAPFIADNLGRAGRGTLSARPAEPDEVRALCSADSAEQGSFTVSTMRLDSVVKNGFAVSRTAACDAIEHGLVFVNDCECLKADKRIGEGDKIVFRRKGRIIVTDCSAVSKKGRIIVNIKRYK